MSPEGKETGLVSPKGRRPSVPESGGERRRLEAAAQKADGARLTAAVTRASHQRGGDQPVAATLISHPPTPGALADKAVLVDGVAFAHYPSTIGLGRRAA